MNKILKYFGFGFLTLSLMLGLGVGSAGATLTLGALTVDSSAALTLGATNATSIGIGSSAIATTINGSLVAAPTRVAGSYAYGVKIASNDGAADTFFTGTAATKSYLLGVFGDREADYVATGDSNDALIRASGNNYAANDSNFIFRGLNTSIANRSGGTMGILEGAAIGAQGKSGGTVPTIRGLMVTSENYGTTATEFGGVDVLMKNEGAVATTEYGVRVRNENNSLATAIDAGYMLSDTGANTGFTYGLDMNGATIGSADIRLANGATIGAAAAPDPDAANVTCGVVGSLYLSSADGSTWHCTVAGVGAAATWVSF